MVQKYHLSFPSFHEGSVAVLVLSKNHQVAPSNGIAICDFHGVLSVTLIDLMQRALHICPLKSSLDAHVDVHNRVTAIYFNSLFLAQRRGGDYVHVPYTGFSPRTNSTGNFHPNVFHERRKTDDEADAARTQTRP